MDQPVIVIMAGGRGERFWPISRRNFPKQLLSLASEASLLQEAVDRVRPLTDLKRILVVVNRDYLVAVREQLPYLPPENILVEPEGRNTAACIGLAATYASKRFPGEDPALLFLPSDPLVKDSDELRRGLIAGFKVCQEHDGGVIFGMQPSRPETGYGYIHLGQELGVMDEVAYFQVSSFTEKPDLATAEAYLASRDYLWNGGMFLWRLSKLQQELELRMPQLVAGLEQLKVYLDTDLETAKLQEIYPKLPAVSFDYGVLEKSQDLIVIPTDFGWEDLGSWRVLGQVVKADSDGNVVKGEYLGIDSKDCTIYSAKKFVATLGVSDLIIVESDDVLFVCSKEKAQDIKVILAKLKQAGREDLL